MAYSPFFIQLAEQNVMVIGGNEQAYFKTRELMERGARVTVWSPAVIDAFHELKENDMEHLSILLAELTYDMAEQILRGKNAPLLVVVATDDPVYNAKIEALADSLRILVNNTTSTNCRLQFSANLFRGELGFAVHAPNAPQLSSALKEEIKEHFPATWAQAHRRYLDLATSENLQKLPEPQRIEELRRLATALVKADGDMDDALGLLSGELELHESEDTKEETNPFQGSSENPEA